MRVRPGRVLLVAVALVVSVVLVAFAFLRLERQDGVLRIAPRFDFGAWLTDLPSHLPWVVPFVVLTATLSALRALVWGWTLPLPVPKWRDRFYALALGGFVHNALPGHLGVLAAPYVLHRQARTPLAGGVSSLLLAKLLEFGALLTATAGLALMAGGRGLEGRPAQSLLWVGFGALVIFSAAIAGARRFGPGLAARLLARGRFPRVAAALGSVAGGLAAAGSVRRLGAGLLLGLAPVFAATLAYGWALRHMGVSSYLLGGGLLVGALALAQLTPGAPTAVGLYYFVCSATARALGVEERSAAALALLSHLSGVATHILVGLAAALAHHDRLRELLRFRHVAGRPPATSP